MALGPFFVGQIPGNPLVLTVKDETTDTAKNLSAYSGATIKLVGPNGTLISTTDNGGSASILSAADGTVRYDWPTVSLFSDAGDYKLQIALTNTNVNDLTLTTTFEVYEALGG